ncbi:MAG: alkyl hydroperoxide reductase [Candidatus Hydrogenedentota bacterium]
MNRYFGVFVGALTAFVSPAALANSVDVPEKPTFAEHVAPIFYSNCISCHRPGEVAPMSLLTFEEARPWAKSIKENVTNGKMPPWHATESVGPFTNDRSLEPNEVETIARWAAKPVLGDKSKMPALPEFPDPTKWKLGTPDLVVTLDAKQVPAEGSDQFFEIPAKTGLTEDKWITAIEVMPSNRKVTHHVIVWQLDENGDRMNGWLGAWAAGMGPMEFPKGAGRFMPKGGSILGDMHYHTVGEAATDTTKVGLHFAKVPVEKELVNLWIVNQEFEIPAGAENYGARANFTFPQDSYIMGFLPHMHYRGKDFTYTARYPDGRKETLLAVNKYDFNWQTNYQLAEPLLVPKGTRIDCEAHWNNSASNLANPDPTKTVRNGSESYDEMMIGFVDYVVKEGVRPLSPDDLIAQKASEIFAEHPGEVYIANATAKEPGGKEQYFPGLMHIAKGAETGTWYINLLGSTYEAPITKAAWDATGVSGDVAIMGVGKFPFHVSVDGATGDVTGKIDVTQTGDGDQSFSLEVKGHLVK